MTANLTHLDEVSYLREQREKTHGHIKTYMDGQGQNKVTRLFRAALDRPIVTLRTPTDEDYRLPVHFAKTMAPKRLQELRALSAELRDFCSGLAGMPDDEASVVCNGDETVLFLRDAFTDVMLAHAQDRLDRPSFKERDRNMLWRWFRLMDEFGWWFVDFTCVEEPGHRAVLGGIQRVVAWKLYQATWACHVEVTSETIRVRDLPEHMRETALDTLEIFGFDYGEHVAALVQEHPEIAADVTGLVADLKAELAEIADDLREVKALLIRSHPKPERAVQLPGGLWASWRWEVGQRSGAVILGPTLDSLSSTLPEYVSVGLDGLVEENMAPWVKMDDAAVRWSVGLLRPLRDRLVTEWLAIERPAPPASTDDPGGVPLDVFASDEVVAAACEVLAAETAEDDESDTADDDTRRGYRHCVPAVREHTLMRLMERHFDCEVNFSKGSEVTVYRHGGKKFTLPGKRRGQYMPSFVIIQMLKRLGITASEFSAIARKT